MCVKCNPERIAHIRKTLSELIADLRTIHKVRQQRPHLKPAVQRQDWCQRYAPKGIWAVCRRCGHPRSHHITELNGV